MKDLYKTFKEKRVLITGAWALSAALWQPLSNILRVSTLIELIIFSFYLRKELTQPT